MLRKVLLYGLGLLVVFVVLQTVVAAVFTALALLWTVLATGVTLAVFLGLCYGAYKLYGLVNEDTSEPRFEEQRHSGQTDTGLTNSLGLGSDSNTGTSGDETPTDPVDRLHDQYASGEISEAELERRLERELSSREMDSIDRELQRERR